MNEITSDHVDALIARSGEQGCVNLSHLNELVQEHELEDEEIRALYEQLEERGDRGQRRLRHGERARAPTSTATSPSRRPTRCSSS